MKRKGVLAIPEAIDKGSTHMERIANICRLSPTTGSRWDPESFEDIADEIDSKDAQLADCQKDSPRLNKFMRPYMVSAGIEKGVKFIFCMSPFMYSLLAESEFIEADITYNESRGYRYLFNAVAFNYITNGCLPHMNGQTNS